MFVREKRKNHKHKHGTKCFKYIFLEFGSARSEIKIMIKMDMNRIKQNTHNNY